MDKIIFQVPGYIVRDKSLAHGGRQFTIETQENLSPEHLQRLISLENKLGWFTFNSEIVEAEDLLELPKIDKLKYAGAKSPSQRLRAVLFLLHKQKGGDKENFDNYYNEIMEKLINYYKDQLE